MGWWRRTPTTVIGDPVLDWVDNLQALPWTEPSQLPAEVRERIVAIYFEGLGRGPTEEKIREVLLFARGR